MVLVNGPIDNNLLEFLLLTEFEKRNIKADFEYGIYDCVEQCMQGGNHISPKNTAHVNFTELPAWKNDGYYFGVQFPMVEATLISQMGIWHFPPPRDAHCYFLFRLHFVCYSKAAKTF